MDTELNDVTYVINGAVFEVNRVLGAGFLDKFYAPQSPNKAFRNVNS